MNPIETDEWMLTDFSGSIPVYRDTYVYDSHQIPHLVTGGTPPHKPSSTGRIAVITPDGLNREFFPGVFGAKWRKRYAES